MNKKIRNKNYFNNTKPLYMVARITFNGKEIESNNFQQTIQSLLNLKD